MTLVAFSWLPCSGACDEVAEIKTEAQGKHQEGGTGAQCMQELSSTAWATAQCKQLWSNGFRTGEMENGVSRSA
eukprot:1161727-Pelagomonas_calceolata.AAC.14